jgi:hypothetical protein
LSDDFAHLIPPLRKLVDLRKKRDETKVAAEMAENRFREQEDVVQAALSALGDKAHISLDLGEGYGTWRMQRRHTMYGGVYDHEAAVEALEELGRLEELALPKSAIKFRQKALNDFVKETLEHGGKLPAGIEPRPRIGVTMTHKKGK